MKKNALIVAVTALFLGLSGTVYAETLIGKVTSVDQGGNAITLVSEAPNTSDRKEYRLVWDEDLADIAQLENVNIGQTLAVDAEQNTITRNWKVSSVHGAIAATEKMFLRTEDRTISGDILEINYTGNAMTLGSKDLDEKGQPIQYHVVWDASNNSVQEKLGKAKVGDHITLTADQNMITKNWKAKSIPGTLEAMAQGDIHLLTGEVRQVDRDKNFIMLSTTDPSGKANEQKIVWDDDFKQQAALENAKVGQHLSVRADQNMLTRNWKVTSLS